jgi:hypothetical protein
MPFTPFHMGPGIAFKALLRGSFSLMVFGWAQIVMDIQPLLVLISGTGHLHGFSHTYSGATVLALLSGLTGKYLAEIGLFILDIKSQWPVKIPWWVVFLSAFIGTYSHVALDSLIHSDVEPFYPFTKSNALLGILSVSTLHQLCIYSGLAGAALYYSISWYLKKRNKACS